MRIQNQRLSTLARRLTATAYVAAWADPQGLREFRRLGLEHFSVDPLDGDGEPVFLNAVSGIWLA